MTGKELLEQLQSMTEEQLSREVTILLCDTRYPTSDGDYDNAYYDYDSINSCSFHDGKIQIFGYIQ